jgi:ABC-type Fe3+/spermidine/putrescine transport system ATPase subunit
MQEEVRELQLRLGMATVHVTHDQDEAMAMSDRIIIMNAGRVEQVGTPETVYGAPESVFVAEFMGRCNRLEGTLRRAESAEGWELDLGAAGQIALDCGPGKAARQGERYRVFVRPEHLRLAPAGSMNQRPGVLRGEVHRVAYLGPRSAAHVTLDGGISLLVHLPNRPGPEGAQHPHGSVDVLPLPGGVLSLEHPEEPNDLA